MNPAINSIVARKKDARFWQFITLGLVLLFTATILYRELVPKTPPNILVVNENGYFMGKLEDFPDAKEMHEAQAEIATLCLFQRSPGGPDYEDRITNLFGPEAFKKAQNLFVSERDEFRLKSLHQKVEISAINILRVRGDAVLVDIKGQLLRTGSFESKPFTEALSFNAKMQFVRNPNIVNNGYYPSIVHAFEIQTTAIPTN